MDGVVSKEWETASVELLKAPYSLKAWEKLVSVAVENDKKGINKTTPANEVKLARTSYQGLLEQFPLLFNYWIKYADLEFKQGNLRRAEEIYTLALNSHLHHSIELWLSFLKFKLNTISSNEDEVLELFERARGKIGYHFHADEFYKLYLKFLSTYATPNNQYTKKYYVLLRILVEIPLYNYGYFAKVLFNILTKELTFGILSCLVPKKDVIALKKQTNNNIKEIGIRLKKTFTDVYITTQYKVYQLFKFEKSISRPYFDVSFLSTQEQQNWDLYLSFVELHYPKEIVVLTYERCLLATANYSHFWTRFANYYICSQKLVAAKEVLERGSHFLNSSNDNGCSLLIKLVDLEIFEENILNARDLILGYIDLNVSTPLPIYERLIVVQRLLNPHDDEHFFKLLTEIINETKSDWFFRHMTNYELDEEHTVNFFKSFISSPDFSKSSNFWESLLLILHKFDKLSLIKELNLLECMDGLSAKCIHLGVPTLLEELLPSFDNFELYLQNLERSYA